MKRLIVSAITATLYCAAVPAAPVDEHIRGTILSVTPETLTVRTSSGASVPVALNGETHYLQVVRSSLDKIEPGSYIGTATKDTGSTLVALEVMIFPAAMRGLNAGHFPYDPLPDTTLSGGTTTTTSMMTNGNVSAVTAPPAAPIVNLVPGTISDLSKGTHVFVDAARDGSSLTAGLVAAGVGGLKPP